MMKKELWLIIFFYAVLLAGCSLLFNHFWYNKNEKEYNLSVGLNETQETNGVRLILYQVNYSYEWNSQLLTVYFKLENQENSPAILTLRKNEDTSENVLQLRNPKEHFPLSGYGLNDDVGKNEDETVIFSFSAGKESTFEATYFLKDIKLFEDLECYIPLFINNEKIEFNFPIPSPEQIED
ncbi:hypothetical protein KHA93_08125 [Bacillus sp. FJAT-49732]|uniref:Uncharacterized protein n=1 Tax=Lederbergia citrisecunda TaxID=2833583 RepID=A0A942TK74_9BACI|nr:hypothetical protein [Lederbergia citrisecunda]MBS4199620.1 hypothetical protein [Lederbergia citrisecunda]